MSPFLIKPASSLKGTISLPGDKSIACRSVIISSISRGLTLVKNFPSSQDCLSAVKTLQQLGIEIIDKAAKKKQGTRILAIYGKGFYGLRCPKRPVFAGESGTTLRLILGVLAGQDFSVTLTAGKSLSRRPMLRVTAPLRLMGAKIISRKLPNIKHLTSNAKIEEFPPITIKGGNLKPITYKMPIASAQVKSAILLAGLYAKGKTTIVEPVKTRDHTERMLNLFRAGIKVIKNKIVINGGKELVCPKNIYIPGDISSASFFIVPAVILPDSQILIRNVSLNPSRLGIIRVLKRMGADVKLKTQNSKLKACEPIGDIVVKSSALKGTAIRKKEIPSLIDELPILMVAACRAEGTTIFEGVRELRVKETDRVRSMYWNLSKMGARIRVVRVGKEEKIIIKGTKGLSGAKVRSYGDHRTAMSMTVAGLIAEGATYLDDVHCINKSFPGFLSAIKKVMR